MPIDFYYLEFSPPCRSVLLLAKAIGVHLNLKTISPMKGEHMKSEFVKVIPSFYSKHIFIVKPIFFLIHKNNFDLS